MVFPEERARGILSIFSSRPFFHRTPTIGIEIEPFRD
jgi:hypothetical protein